MSSVKHVSAKSFWKKIEEKDSPHSWGKALDRCSCFILMYPSLLSSALFTSLSLDEHMIDGDGKS